MARPLHSSREEIKCYSYKENYEGYSRIYLICRNRCRREPKSRNLQLSELLELRGRLAQLY